MAQIQKGQTFADGDLVTGVKLNNIVDLAILLPNSITDQTAVTSFDVQSTDYFLIYDSSAVALRKCTVDDIFRSGQVVKFQSISAVSASDLTISIGGSNFFVVNGNTNISGNLVGTGLIQGATGKFTTELTVPSGTTGTRPSSPITGSLRYNTETGFTEVYNGTGWSDGNILALNNTFTGENTFSKISNTTGSIKYNGTSAFGLIGIYEESFTFSSIPQGSLAYTSSTFTKPIDELWIVEVDCALKTQQGGWCTLNITNNAGTAYSTYIDSFPSNIELSVFKRFTIQVGTALTSETIKLYIGAINNYAGGSMSTATVSGNNLIRIYKYKTASGTIVNGKTYTNNGTSVTVTSVAHGLTSGQVVNIFADKSSISGKYTLTSVATDTFVFANNTTAGTGTLSYIP